jgi:hypothetical protein
MSDSYGLPPDDDIRLGLDAGVIPSNLGELAHWAAKRGYEAGQRSKESKMNGTEPAKLDFEAEESNYQRWYKDRGKYWQPTDDQRRVMFEAVRKLDHDIGVIKLIWNYAHSFRVILKNGKS